MARHAGGGAVAEPGSRRPVSHVDGLAQALGRPAGSIEFLPLDQGRALSGRFEACRSAFSQAPLASVLLVTSTRDRAVVEGVLAWLATQVPQQDAVLLRPIGGASGGARTTATEVLLRALELLRVDPNSEVRAISPDAAFGLALGVVRSSREDDETIYRLVSWGFRAV